MRTWKLKELTTRTDICSAFLPTDESGREINIYNFSNVTLTGENLFFPNVLLYAQERKELYNPSEEAVMSLPDSDPCKTSFVLDIKNATKQLSGDYFYFIYNTDNYYHFLYDSLPYLVTYLYLRKRLPNLKLLMNFPNPSKNKNYPFVDECLELIGINKQDVVIADDEAVYENIYVSSSYTYGSNPSAPPRKEIFQIYQMMKHTAMSASENIPLHDNIYISRRSWLHKDYSNIGTNYTDRRRMMNEDLLVATLEGIGFEEVFCENLTMTQKIILFSEAKKITGAIGGGLANVLFSSNSTELICILSPSFLEYNRRFLHSFNNVSVAYTNNHKLYESGKYKKFMRVKLRDGLVGEIKDVYDDEILLQYSDETVAGWNNQRSYKTKKVSMENIVWQDSGINSPWLCDVDEVYKLL